MRQARRFSVITVALAVGFGVAAGPAAARRLPFKILSYKVTYEGSGSYSVKGVDGPAHNETSSGFHWKAEYNLTFIDKKGSQVGGTSSSSNGGGDWKISSDNGGGDVCTKSGGLKLQKNGAITGTIGPTGGLPLRLTPGSDDYSTTGGSSGSTACDTTDFWQQWVESFSKVGTADSVDPLTALVKLSKKDLSFGKLIFNVSNKKEVLAFPSLSPPEDCGSGDGATCTQSFDWKGTVTFRKTKTPGAR